MDEAVKNATSLLTSALGGYRINGDDLPDEKYHGNIFIADSSSIEAARRVWRWNINGFGYSVTGVDGPYSTAITADNTIVTNVLLARIITGEMIKAGTITADNIAGGTITGDKIAGNTITGSKIQAGTINGDRLIAGTVEADKLKTSDGNAYGVVGNVNVDGDAMKGLLLYDDALEKFIELVMNNVTGGFVLRDKFENNVVESTGAYASFGGYGSDVVCTPYGIVFTVGPSVSGFSGSRIVNTPSGAKTDQYQGGRLISSS